MSDVSMVSLTLQPGQRILWYEIEGILGQGGFGITYLAKDTNLSRRVAIKEYFPSSLAGRATDLHISPTGDQHRDRFDWGLRSFLKEAQTLARFKHENIVQVHSVFEANNTAYMVMEYEEVNSLATFLKDRSRQFSQEFFESILFPIIDGLQLIHNAGFIHRDIKPNNIIVRRNGSPVLIDFGSARQTASQRTGEMTALISQGYTPPEQYSASFGEQGPWTDIYSLAASIYHGIVGHKPADALARGTALLANQPDPMPALRMAARPGYSETFLEALDKALALRPAERPQSLSSWMLLFRQGHVQGAAPVVPAAHDDPTLVTGAPPMTKPLSQITLPPEAQDAVGGGRTDGTVIRQPDGAAQGAPVQDSRGSKSGVRGLLLALPLAVAALSGGWWYWQQQQGTRNPDTGTGTGTSTTTPPDDAPFRLSDSLIRQLPAPPSAQTVVPPYTRLDEPLQLLIRRVDLYQRAGALLRESGSGSDPELERRIDATLDDIEAFAGLAPVQASAALSRTLATLLERLAPDAPRAPQLRATLQRNAAQASPESLRRRLDELDDSADGQPLAQRLPLLYGLASLTPEQRQPLTEHPRWAALVGDLHRRIVAAFRGGDFAAAARLLELALALQPDDRPLRQLQQRLQNAA